MNLFRLLNVLVQLLFVVTLSGVAFASTGTAAETVVQSVSPGGEIAVEDGKWGWSGKSKRMFDSILKNTPFFVRGRVQSRMEAEIKRRKLSVVSEKDMYAVVDAVTPRLYKSSTLKAMENA